MKKGRNKPKKKRKRKIETKMRKRHVKRGGKYKWK